jgi:hypothetical protein
LQLVAEQEMDWADTGPGTTNLAAISAMAKADIDVVRAFGGNILVIEDVSVEKLFKWNRRAFILEPQSKYKLALNTRLVRLVRATYKIIFYFKI